MQAICESPNGQLNLCDIYSWFQANFAHFRSSANSTWKVMQTSKKKAEINQNFFPLLYSNFLVQSPRNSINFSSQFNGKKVWQMARNNGKTWDNKELDFFECSFVSTFFRLQLLSLLYFEWKSKLAAKIITQSLQMLKKLKNKILCAECGQT